MTPQQKSRFTQFKQWLAACGLPENQALSIDKQLRKERYSAAHGSAVAHQAATVQQMLLWTDQQYAHNATASSAVKKFVRVAARLSTTGKPLQLDMTTLPQVALFNSSALSELLAVLLGHSLLQL